MRTWPVWIGSLYISGAASLLTCRWASKQGDPALDHSEGFGDNDGTPPQSRGPMPRLGVVAFQSDSLALALIMVADRQHQRIDAIAVGAEQAHLPACQPVEQPPEGPFVAVAALPVN